MFCFCHCTRFLCRLSLPSTTRSPAHFLQAAAAVFFRSPRAELCALRIFFQFWVWACMCVCEIRSFAYKFTPLYDCLSIYVCAYFRICFAITQFDNGFKWESTACFSSGVGNFSKTHFDPIQTHFRSLKMQISWIIEPLTFWWLLHFDGGLYRGLYNDN